MGGLFKSKRETKTNQNFTRQSRPLEDPENLNFFDTLRSTVLGRLNEGSLPAGFEEGGIRNINSTFDVLQRSLDNSLTRRGLSGSPVAFRGDQALNFARGDRIADFRSRLPVLRRDLENQDLRIASSIFGLRPRGFQSSGSSSGTSTTESSPALFDSITSLLGFAAGLGGFSPLSGVFGGGGGTNQIMTGGS